MKIANYFVAFFLLINLSGYAQVTIYGRVINKADKKPIANATVFLNKTGIATTTNDSGYYALKNITKGHYSFIISLIGYQRYEISIPLSFDMHLADIELSTENENLNEVTITGKKKVQPYYYTFFKDFFGNTQFANRCKILNPEVIQFYDTDTLGNYSAKSNTFIEIENNALGYRIKLLLNYFTKKYKDNRTDYDGVSYFEEMKGTTRQEATWQKNRLECYQGSQMQFLRALLAGTTREEGYKIKKAYLEKNPYYDPNELFTDMIEDEYLYDIKDTLVHEQDILRKTNKQGLFAIARMDSNPHSCLYIEYTESGTSHLTTNSARVPWIWTHTSSYVLFNKPYVIFDYNGEINTHGVIFTGFLGEQREANQLPMDYEPTE